MKQNIFAAILVVAILATGFVWFRYIRQPVSSGESSAAIRSESEILNTYRQLKGLQFDASVFSEPAFQALVTPRVATTTSGLPAGRANPFTPF